MTDIYFLEELSVEGPAFSRLIKILASILMFALFFWGYLAAQTITSTDVSWSALGVIGISLVLCSIFYYWILHSRTSVRQGVIEQTWIWHKRVLIKDLTQAKFIYIPFLSWLISPRLVVRSGMRVDVFHAASPEVYKLLQN